MPLWDIWESGEAFEFAECHKLGDGTAMDQAMLASVNIPEKPCHHSAASYGAFRIRTGSRGEGVVGPNNNVTCTHESWHILKYK